MEKQLQIFKCDGFGQVRTIIENEDFFFVAIDVCIALGIDRTSTRRLESDEKGVRSIHTPGGTQTVTVVNEFGLYNLVLASRKPNAKAFKRWITHDVIPAIRKTGSYAINAADLKAERIATMKRNAKVREANLWVKLAQDGNETFKQVCRTYAANVLAEKEIISLPKLKEKTYTATEIGKILGISANTVGKIANANGLKSKEYGEYFHDKSRYSNKQVESFRYYECAIDAFQKIIKAN